MAESLGHYSQSRSTINPKEYKRLINQKNVLGDTTLNVTLKELASRKESLLLKEIQRILDNNKIGKPELHSNPQGLSTNYYIIDLSSEQIDSIIHIFLDLETTHVTPEGKTTPTASFYASIVDQWGQLLDNSEDISGCQSSAP